MTKADLIKALQDDPSPDDTIVCASEYNIPYDETKIYQITELQSEDFNNIAKSYADSMLVDGYETQKNKKVIILT